MEKIKFMLIVFGGLCILSINAQEEFFGNNNGLSASYSQVLKSYNNDFTSKSGQLSLYLHNGLIFSGEYSKLDNIDLYGLNIGYLINNINNNGLKCLIALSYGELQKEYKITSFNLALMQIFLSKTNFPFSIGSSISMNCFIQNKMYSLMPAAVIGYSQSFFYNNTIYPIIGISKSFLLFNNNTTNRGDLIFHIGINIRLSKHETPKSKIK